MRDNSELELQLLVSGMPLSPEFGSTARVIEEDGFEITARVEMLLSGDCSVSISKSIGLGVIGFADVFDRICPDILLVLGDRFEMLAAAQAAMVARIPIAHVHGGESTVGAIDEATRHAITKMAHLHFVAADAYRRRVIQMGEVPEHVFNVGAPGLDHLTRVAWLSRSDLERELDMELAQPTFLVTYHPATLERRSPAVAMEQLLDALDRFPCATL